MRWPNSAPNRATRRPRSPTSCAAPASRAKRSTTTSTARRSSSSPPSTSTSTRSRSAVEEACDERRAADWEERVEAGLGAFLGYVAEHPAAARLCLVEALSATRSAAARYEAALQRFIELLRAAAPRPTPACRRRSRRRWSAASPGSSTSRFAAARPPTAADLLPELIGVRAFSVPRCSEGDNQEAKVTVRWQTSMPEWSDCPAAATAFPPSSSPGISASD